MRLMTAYRIAKIFNRRLSKGIEKRSSILNVYIKKLKKLKVDLPPRKAVGQELEVEEKTSNKWETIADIFSFLDTSTLAKENPEAVGSSAKRVFGILSKFIPVLEPINRVIKKFPSRNIATVVKWLGTPTPEHFIHMFAKRKAKETKKEKKEQ